MAPRWQTAFLAATILIMAARVPAQSALPDSALYRIAGTVVSKVDGHFLARARVAIVNVKTPQQILSVVTDDDGKFQFTGLAAGKYSLDGNRRGYIPGSYNQHDQYSTAIVTGAGLDTENLFLRLAPAAYITGKILDETGDPVRNANVALYQVNHDEGVNRVLPNRNASTDDLGAYELGPLAPGAYFVSAQAMPWYAMHPAQPYKGSPTPPGHIDPDLDVAYPVTFYPDVTDADAATPVALKGGDRVQIDIHLNPVPALHLLVHVPVPTGPSTFMLTPQLLHAEFGQESGVLGESVHPVAPGLMEITGVPAGSYTLRTPGNGGNQANVAQVDLANDGSLDTSGGEPSSSVNISVHIAGETTVPPRLAVGLRLPHGLMKAWQTVDTKSEAHLPDVPPGRYEVVAWNFGKPYSIAQVSAANAELSGHMLTVPAGSTTAVSLTLVSGLGSVQGFAKRDGKGTAGAMVVLVPKDPLADPDWFRRDQSDLDGSFQLNSVVPGSYTILAIEDGWDLDWSQPDSLSPYMKKGLAIEVGNQNALTLSQPVEVQRR